jgi:hypothetical protein
MRSSCDVIAIHYFADVLSSSLSLFFFMLQCICRHVILTLLLFLSFNNPAVLSPLSSQQLSHKLYQLCYPQYTVDITPKQLVKQGIFLYIRLLNVVLQ